MLIISFLYTNKNISILKEYVFINFNKRKIEYFNNEN